MSERYSRLFSLTENLYLEGAPVLIAAGALLKDNQTGQVLAQLKFRSISPKEIKAVRVKITPFDTLNRPLGDAVDFQYLDLNISRDMEFGQKTAIPLFDAATRGMAVAVTEVAFIDNSVWCNDTGHWDALPLPKSLWDYFPDSQMVTQFRLQYGEICVNMPSESADLWYCTCGAINRNNEKNCYLCRQSRAKLQAFDEAELRKECDARIAKEKAEEERKAAEAAIAEKERKERAKTKAREAVRKAKKAALVSLIILLLVAIGITGYIVINSVIIPSEQYNDAVMLMEDGEFEKAMIIFEALGDFKDSEEKNTACHNAINEEKYLAAIALMENGKYAEASNAFLFLNSYKDSKEKRTICLLEEKYLAAIALLDEGNYVGALAAFEKLTNYKDSKEKAATCRTAILDGKYDDAIALMNSGKYDEAIAAFEALDGHKDSESKINACNTAILDEKYDEAIALMNSSKYDEAIAAFEALDGYKDSAQKIASAMRQKIKPAAIVGNYISLGTYEQDGNTQNGKENIEWLVLDVKDGKALVISKYILDNQPFDKNSIYSTWETCSLRKWLNQQFFEESFSSAEKTLIATVTLSPDKNPDYNTSPGNATQDKIFLLSLTEANKYLWQASMGDRTAYAAKGYGSSWWLRTLGKNNAYALTFSRILMPYGSSIQWGDILTYGTVTGATDGIRPAMWITIEQ